MTDTLTDVLFFYNTLKTVLKWLHTTAKSIVCIYWYNLSKSLKINQTPQILVYQSGTFQWSSADWSRPQLQVCSAEFWLLCYWGVLVQVLTWQNCCSFCTTTKSWNRQCSVKTPTVQGSHGWGYPCSYPLSALDGCGYSWAGLFTSAVIENI